MITRQNTNPTYTTTDKYIVRLLNTIFTISNQISFDNVSKVFELSVFPIASLPSFLNDWFNYQEVNYDEELLN